jgi:hypothetical protein
MAAAGDLTRSKIGKPTKKTLVKRSAEKMTIGQPINALANKPYDGRRGPWRRSWSSISPRATRCGSWAAARSRIGTALIPCRMIERERDWRNVVDVLLSLSGEYI